MFSTGGRVLAWYMPENNIGLKAWPLQWGGVMALLCCRGRLCPYGFGSTYLRMPANQCKCLPVWSSSFYDGTLRPLSLFRGRQCSHPRNMKSQIIVWWLWKFICIYPASVKLHCLQKPIKIPSASHAGWHGPSSLWAHRVEWVWIHTHTSSFHPTYL